MKKKVVGIGLSILIFVVTSFLSTPLGLDILGKNTLALVLIVIVLLVTEAFPVGITSLVIITLPCFFQLGSLKTVTASFANPVIFFVLASFGISSAIVKVPIAKRILTKILETMGKSIHLIILGFMIVTMFISSIMSNVPATALFMGIALGFLELFDVKEEKMRTGKAMMIGIPFAGMIGGMMTPAGSSINLMALGMLKEFSGKGIPFVDWMIVGTPVALVLLPISWWIIIKVYKPADLEKEKIDDFILKLKTLESPSSKEILVGVIIGGMLILWILSSWITVLDPTMIAIVGMIIMFLPGIEILEWKSFSKEVSWDIILLIGAVMCMGNLIVTHGVAQWLVESILGEATGISLGYLVFFMGIFVFGMQLILPIAPALVSALAIPLMILANTLGLDPIVVIVPLCAYAGCCMILPLDSVPLLTYSTGYYKMLDMARSGILTLISLAFLMSIWILVLSL
ncbi:MAG: SLC13 family permease [Eubacteriaceae bacterium]